MNNNLFDCAIIGGGVSGVFCAFKLLKENKNAKVIMFDTGRPHGKRRLQTEGYFGLFPNSDGKLYLNDFNDLVEISGTRKSNAVKKWFLKDLASVVDTKIITDRSPNNIAKKRIEKSGFNLKLNDHIQLLPKDIHILSKYTFNVISSAKNFESSFDDQVVEIKKENKEFVVVSGSKTIRAKRVVLCVGRSGWRWAKSVFDSFGITRNDNVARFGIRAEISSNSIKEFNKSNCSISNDKIEIGPMSWNGTVIPEDHIDMAIASFRSNEGRWKTDKVSFNLFGKRQFENNAFDQTNRIGQLTFILSNERVSKEKISTILTGKSKISIIPEYDWLSDALGEVSAFMPELNEKGYFYMPTILPLVPKVNVKNNFETDIDNLFVAGESAGTNGILFAALSGLITADAIG